MRGKRGPKPGPKKRSRANRANLKMPVNGFWGCICIDEAALRHTTQLTRRRRAGYGPQWGSSSWFSSTGMHTGRARPTPDLGSRGPGRQLVDHQVVALQSRSRLALIKEIVPVGWVKSSAAGMAFWTVTVPGPSGRHCMSSVEKEMTRLCPRASGSAPWQNIAHL